MNDTTMLHEGFITTKEASRLFKYTPSYLAHLIRIKKIHAYRLGRSWLIEQNSLLYFIEHRGKGDIKSIHSSTHQHVPQEHDAYRASIDSVAVPLLPLHTVSTAQQSVSDGMRHLSQKWRRVAFMAISLAAIVAMTVFGFGVMTVTSPTLSQAIGTLETLPGSMGRMHLALGKFVIMATHAVIAADVALAYGIAAAAPITAHVTAQILISIGGTLSSATAHISAQMASVLAYRVQ